ncbi:AI-2E family transporter [Microbacterium sp. W1N]|uniref:AI-2E family transporter n=1 Tax=Microbacterium festucae TaxID=2977531 RepID=UPI0021C09135|nr:AI-2E family transporter [Microbacterium festucae]MCT9819668.1 AI-2E family transporter [Microbacterium festucae]
MWPFRAKPKPAPTPVPDPPAEPADAVPNHRTAFILLALGGAALASFGIAAMASVFAAAFFGLVLTICVYPVRRRLESRGVPRGVATVVILLAVVALLGSFIAALVISIGQFLTLLPQYTPQLEQWLTDVGDWLEGFGIGATQVEAILSSFQPSALIGYLGSVVGSAAGLVSSAVVLLTVLILMAADSSYAATITAGITERRPAVGGALLRFTDGVRRYMVVTTALGLAQGAINWAALAIMGIPGAALWGLLSFLCSFIPNIGYFIALVPPIVFGALTGGWPLVVAVIVVYGVFNAVIQSVIQPKVVGNAVSLSQTITFVSVLFWAVVLGPMGAILAVPLTLLVRMILIDSDPRTAWIRPALGEVDGAKRQMEAEDAAAKMARRVRREQRRDDRMPPPAARG